MLVKVKAARRESSDSTTIFDRPLGPAHAAATPDGGLQLTFIASGIRSKERESSQYRYTMTLSAEEIALLNGKSQK